MEYIYPNTTTSEEDVPFIGDFLDGFDINTIFPDDSFLMNNDAINTIPQYTHMVADDTTAEDVKNDEEDDVYEKMMEYLNEIRSMEGLNPKFLRLIDGYTSDKAKFTLGTHQQHFTAWVLYKLFKMDVPGAFNTDEPGLGKTLQAIVAATLFVHMKEIKSKQQVKSWPQIAVILKSGQIKVWMKEINKFLSSLEIPFSVSKDPTNVQGMPPDRIRFILLSADFIRINSSKNCIRNIFENVMFIIIDEAHNFVYQNKTRQAMDKHLEVARGNGAKTLGLSGTLIKGDRLSSGSKKMHQKKMNEEALNAIRLIGYRCDDTNPDPRGYLSTLSVRRTREYLEENKLVSKLDVTFHEKLVECTKEQAILLDIVKQSPDYLWRLHTYSRICVAPFLASIPEELYGLADVVARKKTITPEDILTLKLLLQHKRGCDDDDDDDDYSPKKKKQKTEEDPTKECCRCLSQSSVETYLHPCFHWFHEQCITSNTCPSCDKKYTLIKAVDLQHLLTELSAIGRTPSKEIPPKIRAVNEYMRDMVKENEKTVIMANHVNVLELAAQYIPYSYLYDTKTPMEERDAMLGRFCNPHDLSVKTLLITISSGSESLNLQVANHQIFLQIPDRGYRYRQSIKRVQRLDQTKKVNIVFLLTEGTVEDRLSVLLRDVDRDVSKFMEECSSRLDMRKLIASDFGGKK